MNNTSLVIPKPINEPVLSYAPGTPERARLQAKLAELKQTQLEIPAFIGGQAVFTGNTETISPPHEHQFVLGKVHNCGAAEVEKAITACRDARREWMDMAWTDRAAIFLRAATLLAGPWRETINAATMLGQSKNPHQAEIDSACELIDFLRFNAYYMAQIYADQPYSPSGIWNQLQYRPLEGFVLAVTPFNFTAIQGNLCAAPAMMGNTVIWKPSTTAIYSAYYVYKLFEEAGLPAGVINMLPGFGPDIGDPAMASPEFAGLHFTGSTRTFNSMWQTIGSQINTYRAYPRIVGETGGKDFILAHPSANADEVATAIVRGGYEYQGQKCSAASRVYVPKSLWPRIQSYATEQMAEIKVGSVEDFSNYMNAVIDRKSFDKLAGYIDRAKADSNVTVEFGGTYDDATGYFINPTLLRTDDPKYATMCEELFGPVVSLYVYDDAKFDETVDLVNNTSPYALTGSIFARDRKVIRQTMDNLVDAAGNFYINDKPTGAVVGQQPFGGARGSGTNDKAGSYLNLIRWVSPRTIKENFSPPRHFGYDYLLPE